VLKCDQGSFTSLVLARMADLAGNTEPFYQRLVAVLADKKITV